MVGSFRCGEAVSAERVLACAVSKTIFPTQEGRSSAERTCTRGSPRPDGLGGRLRAGPPSPARRRIPTRGGPLVGWRSLSSSSRGLQELVDLTDRDRALPDGGCDTLDRAAAYVAHGEHALAAGLEHPVVAVGGASGEHEALSIQRDFPLEPAGLGGRADWREKKALVATRCFSPVWRRLCSSTSSSASSPMSLAPPRCCARP